jgi:uncharacterized membrane-anchored protein
MDGFIIKSMYVDIIHLGSNSLMMLARYPYNVILVLTIPTEGRIWLKLYSFWDRFGMTIMYVWDLIHTILQFQWPIWIFTYIL